MLVKKEFLKYVIPSIAGMLVVSADILVDGIFLGRGIGPNAIAAVSLVSPMLSIISAIAIFLSVGGATLASVHLGQGKIKEANEVFNKSFLLVVLSTAAIWIVSFFFTGQIIEILGATPELYDDAFNYLRYYCMLSMFGNLSITLANFARTDGSPVLAMICYGVGSVLNVVFDYIFIYKLHMGVSGAAMATQLGDFFGLMVVLIHFMRKKGNLRFAKVKFKDISHIIKIGTPELMVQLANPISVFVFNVAVIRLLGEMGLASYGIISYIITFIVTIFLGISQGIQPLISYNYGRRDYDKINKLIKMAVKFSLIISISVYLLILFFGKTFIGVFTTVDSLITITNNAIRIHGLSLIIVPVNLIYISYFTATAQIRAANIIAMLRGAIFILIYVIVLPKVMGSSGLWFAMIFVEISSFITIKLYQKFAKSNIIFSTKQKLVETLPKENVKNKLKIIEYNE